MQREFLIFLISIFLVLQYGIQGCAMIPLSSDSSSPSQVDYQDGVPAWDVALGMKPKDVVTAWGEPHQILHAGSSNSGNEKWVYFDGSSKYWSDQGARVVYFEKGRVVGWDSKDGPLM